MWDILRSIFSSDEFMPHGHCYFWRPELVWLHVISDGVITLAYMTIPLTLVYVARARRDLPFNWMFLCFGTFIVACGLSHAMEIWTLWVPTYFLSGGVKALTAGASATTAFLLVRLTPRIVQFPTRDQLQRAYGEISTVNEALQRHVLAREEVERERDHFFSLSVDILCIASRDGYFKRVNPAFSHILGYSAETLLTTPFKDLIHPSDRSGTLEEGKKLAAGQTVTNFQNRYLCADGSYKWLAWNCSALEGVIYASARDVTELRQATLALEQSEERYRNIVEVAAEGIWIIDHQSKTTFANRRMADMLEYSEEEMRGMSLFDFMDEEGRAIAGSNVERRKEGIAEQHDFKFRKKSGEDLWAIISTSPQVDKEGRYVGALATVTDITERRRVEMSERKNRELLAAVIEGTADGICVRDETGRYLLVNRAFASMVGASVEELTATMADPALFGDEPSASHPFPESTDPPTPIRSFGGPRTFQRRFVTKGDERTYLCTETAYRDGSGTVVGALCVWHDVTELKRAEEQRLRVAKIEADERHYRQIAEAIPQIVWTARPDGFVDSYNQRWFDYTGLTLEQTQGWGWNLVLHPDDEKPCREKWALALASESPYQIEYRFRRASDGTYRWHLGRALPLRDHEGTITKWLGTCTDIDDQKRSEEAMLRVQEQLEERVRERTTQLLAARDAAESASRAKSEFLANMSHEIRTPMNGVLGLINLLLDAPHSDEQAKYYGMMRGSARGLLQIINDVLDSAKLEAGKLELETLEFDLRDGIGEVLRSLEPKASEKRLRLRMEVAGGLPTRVVGDLGRLRQVLINLLGNAIKFTESGEVLLEVLSEEASASSLMLRFVVSDTGIGISPDKQDAIFDPFSQAETATTRKYGGSGLGLSICARLVGLMRGRIWVESELGAGARFFFTAALLGATPDDAARNQADPGMLERSGGESHVRPLRILLAEDNEINQLVARRVLENVGHHVTIANNGVEALRAYERETFDLIVMDCQMPELDGFHVTREIRARERVTGKHIPIIASTAYAMQGDRERCLSCGMDAYVSKPLDPLEFAQAVAITYEKAQRAAVLDEVGPPVPWTDEHLGRRTRGGKAFVRKVVEVYLSELPLLFAEMEAAVAASDLESLARAAHTLKGSSLSIGAQPLARLLQELEKLARKGDEEGALSTYQALQSGASELRQLLQTYAGEVAS